MDKSLYDYCDELVERYVDVCNRALDLNKDRFPFKQILGAAQVSEKESMIEVDVIDAVVEHSYAMTIKAGRIVVKPHGDCDDCGCDRKWPVTLSYLRDVVENPDAHISNPAIIDWGWIYDVSEA